MHIRSFIHERLSELLRSGHAHLSPPRVFLLSFGGLILVGTLGFQLLPGLYIGAPLSWTDSLFTATSAVCVTGLIVVDTNTYFTPFGQAYILLLIQAGGIGFITFTSLIILLVGQRLSIRQEQLWRSTAAPGIDYRKLIRSVVLMTFSLEAIGAGLLYTYWPPEQGHRSLWQAIFHSISAFCNAGFSTYSDSLIQFQKNPLILMIISGLIVAGGLGFSTIQDLSSAARSMARGQRTHLQVTSKLILTVTLLLIALGAVGYLLSEWRGAFREFNLVDKISNALFMSITARTAGFNSIDYGMLHHRSAFFTILLMVIGGAPGSMAGGLKVTTVAVIGLMAWSRLLGRSSIRLFNHSIPEENVQRAIGLFVLSFGVMTASVLFFSTTEFSMTSDPDFLTVMFEVASAFNTVGLSMGLTDDLSIAGKLGTVILMFMGRVGPLTFSAAISLRKRSNIRMARAEVPIG
ncbi:MAG: TrkH family potassium uptake protein [Leptospiraceae bacterium]|nr:TrkH family potassium uptake protein [Leptospiraceae bacterium]MCB1322166.1 TrkH family potassium uptake protein [Leptospiraceae bacterium]